MQDFGLMDGVEFLVEATKNVMMVIVNGYLEGAQSVIGHKWSVFAVAADSGSIIVVQVKAKYMNLLANNLKSNEEVLINRESLFGVGFASLFEM